MKWPFGKSTKIARLEEEVRQERGSLAVTIVKLDREDFKLDRLVKHHLELLHRDESHS